MADLAANAAQAQNENFGRLSRALPFAPAIPRPNMIHRGIRRSPFMEDPIGQLIDSTALRSEVDSMQHATNALERSITLVVHKPSLDASIALKARLAYAIMLTMQENHADVPNVVLATMYIQCAELLFQNIIGCYDRRDSLRIRPIVHATSVLLRYWTDDGRDPNSVIQTHLNNIPARPQNAQDLAEWVAARYRLEDGNIWALLTVPQQAVGGMPAVPAAPIDPTQGLTIGGIQIPFLTQVDGVELQPVIGRLAVMTLTMGKTYNAQNFVGIQNRRVPAVQRTAGIIDADMGPLTDEPLLLELMVRLNGMFGAMSNVRIPIAREYLRWISASEQSVDRRNFSSVFRLLDGTGLGFVAMIVRLLNAHPWLGTIPELRPEILEFYEGIRRYAMLPASERGYQPIIQNSRTLLFNRNALGALLACAIAFAERTNSSAGHFARDPKFDAVVNSIEARISEYEESHRVEDI